jgi:hypothetical protein
MTLMKSILLGSAAGIVAVASAHAADLPTKKAAPVEYVRVCNVGGITGWTLPGLDTCVKFSGYITGQFTGGNLNTQYNYGSISDAAQAASNTLVPQSAAVASALAGIAGGTTPTGLPLDSRATQRVLIQASPAQLNTTFYRPERLDDPRQLRLRLGLEHRLRAFDRHFDINSENGNGFDNTGGYIPISTPVT